MIQRFEAFRLLSQFATFIVGHVTQEGHPLAGLLLEHMVDTVLYLVNVMHLPYFWAVKNRFGSTRDWDFWDAVGSLLEIVNLLIFLENIEPGFWKVTNYLSWSSNLVTPTVFGNANGQQQGLDPIRQPYHALFGKRCGLLLQMLI